MLRERLITVEDLWRLSHQAESDSHRLELSEGILIEMPPAGSKHGVIIFQLAGRIFNHIEIHDLGYGTGAETGFVLFRSADGKDTVRAPGIGFVAKVRLPDGIPDGYIPFAPDLAVEVVSPNDDLDWKITQCLKYGTRRVWVLYPKSRRLKVYTPQTVVSLEKNDILDGEDVLPGFRIKVADIFNV